MLYLIPFLHQTTTLRIIFYALLSCILFHFYIKPQPEVLVLRPHIGCILFHFYIKPQRRSAGVVGGHVVSYSISTSNHNFRLLRLIDSSVVSYSISTSNHNKWIFRNKKKKLYLIPFLHQTTTFIPVAFDFIGCILFHFYIKPQHRAIGRADKRVVSYSISTSNHNIGAKTCSKALLYLIPFLHQTTTRSGDIKDYFGCILFHFYIKPQLQLSSGRHGGVVSYSISTSNHNLPMVQTRMCLLYLIPFLHQTTTVYPPLATQLALYLIPFLHQTTTCCP